MPRKSNNEESYSTKEVMEKLNDLHEIVQRIEIQTTKTNGRVNALEERSKSNVDTFNREKDTFERRLCGLEESNLKANMKIAAISATIGVVVSIITMVLSKLL